MKNILFTIMFLIFNFGVAQITSPKLHKPPPSDYQKESDSTTAAALRFIKQENIPGLAISVSIKGHIIYSNGLGYSDIKSQSKVDPAVTQFRIASISKSLTALAMAKLVDDNKLDFYESIYTYLPDFPKKEYDITVKQVAGHLAGIRHYKGQEFILNKKMSITEGLDLFKNDPLEFKPGTEYKYSTYGWNLLSVVVQKAAKQTFNNYMTNSVFQPLKMYNTVIEKSDSIMLNRTQFYRKTNHGKIILGPEVNNEFKAAGGGFLSTAEDLILFGNEIINPKLISKETIAELVKSQTLTNGEKTNYGIGFVTDNSQKDTPRYSHSGGGIGATTLLLMYPKEEIVIVILTNISQAPMRDFGSVLESIFIN